MAYRDGSSPCPRCRSPLQREGREPDEQTLSCPACAGAFVSHAAVATQQPRLAAVLRTRMSAVPRAPLACPVCRRQMRRMVVDTGARDVAVDYCAVHGTWFDRDELLALTGTGHPGP